MVLLVLQLADISRMVAQEANLLLLSELTDREKLRLGILLDCIKYGIRRISGGYEIVPSRLELLGLEHGKLKLETGLKHKKLRMFLKQPEESQFFSLGPRDQDGKVSVTMKPQALIPQPSRELRALLPNVKWDPLPTLQTVMTNKDDGEEEGGDNALTTLGATGSAPHSLFNPEPRQVGASPTLAQVAHVLQVQLGENASLVKYRWRCTCLGPRGVQLDAFLIFPCENGLRLHP